MMENADNLNWENVTGGRTNQRMAYALRILSTLNQEEIKLARLEECADERTGRRYGQAKCRVGKAVKIGGGGRNKGDYWAYQVWLVWN